MTVVFCRDQPLPGHAHRAGGGRAPVEARPFDRNKGPRRVAGGSCLEGIEGRQKN